MRRRIPLPRCLCALLFGLVAACAPGSTDSAEPCVSTLDCPAGQLCSGGHCHPSARRTAAATGNGPGGGSGGSTSTAAAGTTGSASASTSGSTSDSASGSGSGSTSGSTSGGRESSSSSSGSSAGGSTGGGNGNRGSYAGEILLEELPYVAGLFDYSAYAYFYPGSLAGSSCSGQQSGNCCYQSAGGNGGTNGGTVQPVGAGPIQLNGGSLPTLVFSASTGYAEETWTANPSLQWSSGDTLSVSAPGDTIGSFSGSVIAPSDFVGLQPPLDSSTVSKVPVPSGEDFTVSWAPGTGTTVALLFGDSLGAAVTCSAPDSAGTVTVPAAQLALLSPGIGSLALTRLTNATVSAGNAQILLQASTELVASATLSGGCGPTGWTCQANADCCGQNCVNGTCGCGEVNAGCTLSSDCCAGTCTYNLTLGIEACNPRPTGSACTQASDCGSGACNGGVCACATVGANASCFTNVDCCTGFCAAPGQSDSNCICSEQGGRCGSDADCCESKQTCSFDTECTACGSNGTCCLALGSSCSVNFPGNCCSGTCAYSTEYPTDGTCQ